MSTNISECAEAMTRKLIAEARRQGLTPMELSKRTNLPYSVAHKVLSASFRRPTLETTIALASALGLTVGLINNKGWRIH